MRVHDDLIGGQGDQRMGPVRRHGLVPGGLVVVALLRRPAHAAPGQDGDDEAALEQHQDRRQQDRHQAFQHHADGGGRPEDAKLLLDICDNIEGKSFCPLGDAAAWPVQSAIKQFPDDFRMWLAEKTGGNGVVPNV